ncbi:hypothetical protein [Methanobrevibacter arboriphilus]|uniref:hypothetical protein n=1 Tax=Methanobrevibacter arboriphilus TaxID=39441 RepID=UPI000AF16728|nr:hypothetical protein [Methanobrevibacter arboriphilus]
MNLSSNNINNASIFYSDNITFYCNNLNNITFSNSVSNLRFNNIKGKIKNINGSVIANNNWWGTNNVTNDQILAPGSDNIIHNSWIVMTIYVINSRTLILDFTYNNLGDNVYSQGNIPNNIPITIITKTTDYRILNNKTVYTENGLASYEASHYFILDIYLVKEIKSIILYPIVVSNNISSKVVKLTANNSTIYYRINNGRWISSFNSVNISLNEGLNSIQYYAIDSLGRIGDSNTLEYYFNLLNYTVEIPNYVNVTYDGYVYNTSSYVLKSGIGGIIKVPFSREIRIRTSINTYIFMYTPFDDVTSGYIDITNGDSYFVYFDKNQVIKLNSSDGFATNDSGILIKAFNDVMTLTYYNFITDDINQFAVIYNKAIIDYERVDFILNGFNQSTIFFK